MTIAPLNAQKIDLSALPTTGQPQGSRTGKAISALTPGAQDAQEGPATKELEKMARALVGQTFYGQLLKQMHESPFKTELFGGGKGEKAFSPLYDQHLIERMSRGAGDKLVRPIVKKFQKQAEEAYRKQKEKGLVSTNRRA